MRENATSESIRGMFLQRTRFRVRGLAANHLSNHFRRPQLFGYVMVNSADFVHESQPGLASGTVTLAGILKKTHTAFGRRNGTPCRAVAGVRGKQ